MADNVTLPGTGVIVAADDVSGVLYQMFKLALGGNGVADFAPGDTSNGLDVDVTRLPALVAGNAKIGVVDLDSDAALGSAVPATAQYIAGTDGTNARGLKTDANGELQIDVLTLPAIPAGTNNIGDVDVLTLPAIPAGTNNIGDVDVLTVPADPFGANADAASSSGSISAKLRQLVSPSSTMNASSSDGATALTNSAQVIKGSAGVLHGYYIFNPNTTTVYVLFYNTAAASVTVGTTNPLFMLAIPPTSAANLWMRPGGIDFSTAMSWAAASTAGGNGAPSTAMDAVAWYI